MREIRPLSSLIGALGLAGVIAGCTTTVYKDDIAAFSKGVDETASAFEGLHARALAKYKNDAMEDFSAEGIAIGVSKQCTGVVSEGQLVHDTSCLAAWAAYRAIPENKRGAQPTCEGASESVRRGEYAFYDLTELGRKEAETCRLGVRSTSGAIDPTPLDDAEVLLTESPKLMPALKSYASALVGIADAADREALQESIGKAKEQVQKLGERVDGLDGKTSPYVSTIGPISDLVGAALTSALEQRRFNALAAVTKSADPVVMRAAMILSNVAMPMTAIELQDAGLAYLEALPDPKNPPKDDAWAPAYEKARAARESYLDLFATSPTPVFKAMAQAHHELAVAFSDPKRQYEALKSAIEDFAEKAKAAYDAYEKAKREAATP